MSFRKFASTVSGSAFLVLSAVAAGNAASQDPAHAQARNGAQPSPPSSIEAEHRELHEKLANVIKSKGRTGAAAREVESLLRPHFEKEEQFALPPLGLLVSLAAGTMPSNPGDIVKMTDHLKAEMPKMIAEHKEIVGALQRLRKAAREERKKEAIQFADQLTAHATQEEEILYPSAILVGEYLKLRPK